MASIDSAVGEIDGAEAKPTKKTAKKLPLKPIIFGGLAFAVLGGGAAAGLFLFHGTKTEHHTAPAVKPAVFVDMPDVLVNLSNTSSDRTQYLKIKIVLEVPDQAVATEIQPLMPRVMDAFQTYLRQLRPSDLEGSAGLYRLREELTRRVNTAVAPGHVNAVLFKEIIIQ
jgi:flagellar protein FliL